jgi:hypothetical protein
MAFAGRSRSLVAHIDTICVGMLLTSPLKVGDKCVTLVNVIMVSKVEGVKTNTPPKNNNYKCLSIANTLLP